MLDRILTELTIGGISRKADGKTKERAETLRSQLVGLSGNILTFKTHGWVQRVQLVRLPKWLNRFREGKKKLVDVVSWSIHSDVKVACSCPSMLYGGFAYIASEGGFKVGRDQTRFPKVRNPGLNGSVCKHLVKVLEDLPGLVATVTRLVKRGMKQEEAEPAPKAALRKGRGG